MSSDRYHLDPDALAGLNALIMEARTIITEQRKSCIHCGHFDELIEQCKLTNQRPPARVIAFGCELYDNNYIPF